MSKSRKSNDEANKLIMWRSPDAPDDVEVKVPVRGTEGSAGLDLLSTKDATLLPYGTETVPTGLCMKPPEGTYGRIAPRSGLAQKMIHVGAGVIDKDYEGELKVVLYNLGKVPYKVQVRFSTPEHAVQHTNFIYCTPIR